MTPEEREQAIARLADVAAEYLDDPAGLNDAAPEMWERVVAPLLVEAERRGAEKGWDECHAAFRNTLLGNANVPSNPYRSPPDAT